MSQALLDGEQITKNLARLQHQLQRAQRKIYALEARSLLADAGKQPLFPIEFTSQNSEDLILWDLFGNQLEGFFIEAGAFDGYRYSVTYAFESIGWNGLLVEPLPEPARICAARRPGSRVVNAALSRNLSASAAFNVVNDHYGGMLSHFPGLSHVEGATGPFESIQIPVTNLNTLLADHQGPIDLLALDVEGAEQDVFAGFDLDRFRPRVVMVEVPPQNHAAMQAFFQQHAYVYLGHSFNNQMFVKNDEHAVLERFKWMNL